MRVALLLVAVAGIGCQSASAADIDVAKERGALIAALHAAGPGDTLRLAKFDYAGPLVITKPLTLKGAEGARVVGSGAGTVISIEASDVVIEDIAVTGSGAKLDSLDAGIAIAKDTQNVRVINNMITENLIGIDVQGARNALVRGNTIIGRNDLRKSQRGPGVYVWNAPGLTVEDNDISGGRDGIFVTTSHHAVYRNNVMHDLRFAFHSMNANDIEVTGNRSMRNDMGYAFMYSRVVNASENVSAGDRTHGIFLNYVTGATIAHNEVHGGSEKCVFVYNVNKTQILRNRFEGCGIGIHFTAGSERNSIAGNAFIGNQTQVKYAGTRWIEWSRDGKGNYWSDQVAFDINGDGIADSAYRPNDMIDRITWSQPMARLLMGSPAVQLIRWSQSRFPGLLPGGIIDSHPLMSAAGMGLPSAEVALKGTRDDQ